MSTNSPRHWPRGLLGMGALSVLWIAAACSPEEKNAPRGYTSGTPGTDASSSSTGGGGGTGGGDNCEAVEVPCNGIDDDCDPSTLDEPTMDADGDGFATCDDCNDIEDSIHPNAIEVCGNDTDENCDGLSPACAACGNGILDEDEICDDGNTEDGDGCRGDCQGNEECGDGILDLATEECDGGQDGACLGACVACNCPTSPGPWRFVDVTTESGIAHTHGTPLSSMESAMAGGMAVGDFDGDGWVDVYAIGGVDGTNTLWRNDQDGTFTDVATSAGVALVGHQGSGATFADIDGDGWLDLLVNGLEGAGSFVFHNEQDGTFTDVTVAAGIQGDTNDLSSALGDYDRDGDLDLFVGHWGVALLDAPQHVWRNEGAGVFTPVSAASGVNAIISADLEQTAIARTFTPTLSDFNDDGWPDLLLVSDFLTSRCAHNDNGTFVDATSGHITDENGMGSAVGDYDNDGDLDWFVSSIHDPNDPTYGTGNRLYENTGDGQFSDATTESGVRTGYWGWGSCFGDFDNDGYLDIFHTNGWNLPNNGTFDDDPSVLYLNDRDGTFTERAIEVGLIDRRQGRGVACVDYDHDGDLDILVSNNNDSLRVFENRLPATRHYLSVTLGGKGANTEAAGARITIVAGGVTQVREIRVGSNYLSQNPALAHFGLDGATTVTSLTVRWPDGATTVQNDVAADQRLHIVEP